MPAKRQVIRADLIQSVSLQAGRSEPRLMEGDLVVLINGRDISEHTHDQVVMFIRASRESHTRELALLIRRRGVCSSFSKSRCVCVMMYRPALHPRSRPRGPPAAAAFRPDAPRPLGHGEAALVWVDGESRDTGGVYETAGERSTVRHAQLPF